MRNLLVTGMILFASFFLRAQDTVNTTVTDKPVRNTFYVNTLAYQQTVSSPVKGGMELFFSHRFGSISNGFNDLFGLYGGVNIRMSLSYGITDYLMAGIGSTMPNVWDLHGKVALLRQTRSGRIPVSVSFFANMAVDARDKMVYDIYTTYSYKHRFSYFYQLMIARKFGNVGALQVSPVIAYYNAVEKDRENFNTGIDVLGRIKLLDNLFFVGQYGQSFTKTTFNSRPGAAGGVEITTATHSFQVFLSNYRELLQQANLTANRYEIGDEKNLCIGFNLTIRM